MENSGRFEAVYYQYVNYVMRIVMYNIRDYQTTQEICQEVFLAFYTNMERIAPGREKVWLYRSAKNACIDHFRMQSRHKELVTDFQSAKQEEPTEPEDRTDLDGILDNRSLLGRILSDLMCADTSWYEAVCLRFIEQLSYEESAELAGVSVGVMRARVCRARKYVRKKYGEEYGL